jgi:hypothetical protein
VTECSTVQKGTQGEWHNYHNTIQELNDASYIRNLVVKLCTETDSFILLKKWCDSFDNCVGEIATEIDLTDYRW